MNNESYLFSDIIDNILRYLDKNSSFNFLNICISLHSTKYKLYGKYIFDYHKSLDSHLFQRVKHLRISNNLFDEPLKDLSILFQKIDFNIKL